MVAVGEYYAKVKIGGQTLRVQIDTGSATLAVPLKECVNCKRGDMRYSINDSNSHVARHISCDDSLCGSNTCSPFGCGKCSAKKACCAHSDGTKCAFHLNFGDGSGAKGILVRDILQWGDVAFPVTFGGIRSDSPDFERSQVDGILGMAYPSLACNPSCITPTFESMLETVKMPNVFTICITYDSGKIVLGEYDPELSTQKIAWVPLQLSNPPSFYSFPLIGHLRINEVELSLPSYSRAIVDSGTTLIVFSHATFDKFKNYLQNNFCEVPGLCDKDSWFRPAHCTKIADEDRLKLPTLKFAVRDFNITLTSSEYLINYASKGPDFWCVGIMALDAMSGGVDVIFGNTVMKKYVTIYDRENSQVGFAESNTNCAFKKENNEATELPVVDPISETKDGDDEREKSDEVWDRPPDSADENASNGEAPQVDIEKKSPDVKADTCSSATNCTSCSQLGEENMGNCVWKRSERICVRGEGYALMCALDGLVGDSGFGFVATGSAVVVVVVIAVVAIVVSMHRKRQSEAASEGDEEQDVQRPLTENEVDTTNAFAIADDDEA